MAGLAGNVHPFGSGGGHVGQEKMRVLFDDDVGCQSIDL